MKKPQLLTIVTIVSALLFSGTEVLAQEDVPRYEVFPPFPRQTVCAGRGSFDVPQFRIGKATYFSTDLGGVVEFLSIATDRDAL